MSFTVIGLIQEPGFVSEALNGLVESGVPVENIGIASRFDPYSWEERKEVLTIGNFTLFLPDDPYLTDIYFSGPLRLAFDRERDLIGALQALYIPESSAHFYQNALENHQVLVLVTDVKSDELGYTKESLYQAHPSLVEHFPQVRMGEDIRSLAPEDWFPRLVSYEDVNRISREAKEKDGIELSTEAKILITFLINSAITDPHPDWKFSDQELPKVVDTYYIGRLRRLLGEIIPEEARTGTITTYELLDFVTHYFDRGTLEFRWCLCK